MSKYFIGITGISTAGKSTLGLTLLSGYFSRKIFSIPHTTYRQARSDDDPRLIRAIDKSIYDVSEFFTIDGNYGTLLSDYKNFMLAEDQVGLSIVSCNEIPDLKIKLERDHVIPVFIALTLTDTSEEEKTALANRLPFFFAKEEQEWRLQFNSELIEDVFFNPVWLKNNGVIRLSQKAGSVMEWVKIISKALPIIEYDEALLAADVRKIMDKQTFSRSASLSYNTLNS